MMEVRQRERPELRPALRAAYQRLVEERVGLRLSEQQVRGLGMTVAAVLATAGSPLTPAELYTLVAQGGGGELFDDLAARLTIGETHFFRVAPQIAALRDLVLPELLARRAKQRRLALWSAGCSSGEEPYTLAILLREQFPAIEDWHLRIFATDLSDAALATARRACYREWSFRETPEPIRGRYFERQGGTWQLRSAIRQMVSFRRLNLVAEPFPLPGPGWQGLDLILCRNVTIYFSPLVTRRLYERFADALAPDGWLLLGPSDPAPPGELFDTVYLPDAILWRKRVTAPLPPRQVASPRAGARSLRPRGAEGTNTRAQPRRPHATPGTTPRSPRQPGIVSPAIGAADIPTADLVEVRALIQAGAREEARARLLHIVRSAPLAVDAHRLLGFLALAEGRTDEALESLRRATFLAADDALAQYGLGRAYRALGDDGRARIAFRQARRILASWPGDRGVPGDEGLSVDDLRGRLAAQLAVVGDSPGGEER